MVADRVFTYAYDAAGRLAQIDYPSSTNISVVFSGPSSEPGWDEAGNLLHMRYLLSSSHLHRFAYTYDDAGNRISMLDTPTTTANAVLWEYGYDWLNRLTSVSRDSTLTTVYTYDESDNRLSLEWPQLSTTHDFTYDDANQIVDRKFGMTTLETYSHDLDGNMIARTAGGVTTEYRWSDKNRLLERKIDSVSAETHKYDTGGIRESDNDGTKYFSSGAVSLADMRPSSIPVSYFQGHQLLGMEVDGDFYYYVTDGLANVRLVLDYSGSIVASAVFDEFGVPEDVSGTADLRPHGYTGGLGVRNDWDSSGLHYMRQRYYDSSLGRWLSADPIGFKGGLNLYTYVNSNPTNAVDPQGLEVRAVFDRATGHLTVTDNSTGKTTHFEAFTGMGPSRNNPAKEYNPNAGPIPAGEYVIGPIEDVKRFHPDLDGTTMWFELEAAESLDSVQVVRDPETGRNVKRVGFFLHPGLVSEGCVTLTSETDRSKGQHPYPRSKEYDRLRGILESTSQKAIYTGRSVRFYSPGTLLVK